jgi:hypothetical protein
MVRQIVTAPMINMMENMDLKYPQVMTTDVYEVIQLTQELYDTLNESNNRFKEFIQKLMKMVPSIASVTP